MKIWFLLTGLLVAPCVPAAYGEGLIYDLNDPCALFPDVNLAVLSHFETGEIHKTLRGFYLRADSFPGLRTHPYDASVAGLYLDVSERDPGEIAKFSDSTKVSGELTERTVDFPAVKGNAAALRITFMYGPKADAGAVVSIAKNIKEVVKAYKEGQGR